MLLKTINTPADLKGLSLSQLQGLCEELRLFLQEQTNTKEGHIRSSLGVTELSVALHYVYDTPYDILIWDVGHQAYIHKILTGRKDQFHTNRQKGGLAGFTSASESIYDPFGAGHASTSISASVGFATAQRLRGQERSVVAVIGDGALTGGMAFEALNYLGEQQLDVLVILNDNESSIDQNIGALARYTNYKELCDTFNINFRGDINGHDAAGLATRLAALKREKGPGLLRVKTQKGKGRLKQAVNKPVVPAFQEVLAQTLMELAESDEHIVAITPAMLSGSGLHKFAARFPQRCFDVGIAEQHAVTMAAGLAADGFKPVVHLYSTFAQRAYDQIIHDVVLQKLPVVFCLDRAGLVGQDGGTHHGAYDPGFLNTLPGVTIAAPLDGMALQGILTMALEDSSPWFIRYPKASFNPVYQQVPKDKQARQLKSGKQRVVLSFGAIGNKVIEALEGSEVAHYDFAFLNPLDCKALANIAKNYSEIFTVEENSARGGLGDTVRACLEELNYTTMVYSRSLPNYFMKHATRVELLADAGLDTQGLKEFLGLA